MKMTFAMQRCAAWIAFCAVLLAALAPSISHALASHQTNASMVEICTMEGSKMIQAGEGQNPEPSHHPHSVDHFEHCPFCKTNAVASGLPPTFSLFVAVIPPRDTFPALFYQAPSGLYVWTAASPRAPPALS